MRYIDHYVAGGRFEAFTFNSDEEMNKVLAGIGASSSNIDGEIYHENPNKTGTVWLFIRVFNSDFYILPAQYVLALKLINAAKDNTAIDRL